MGLQLVAIVRGVRRGGAIDSTMTACSLLAAVAVASNAVLLALLLSEQGQRHAADQDRAGLQDRYDQLHKMYDRQQSTPHTTQQSTQRDMEQGTQEGAQQGIQYSVARLSDFPRIFLIDGLFTGSECERLMKRAAKKLKKSTTIGHDGASKGRRPQERQAETAKLGLSSEVAIEWRERMSRAAMLPLNHTEGLQVTRYAGGKNDRYTLHPDSSMEMGRTATVIVFLSDVHNGGHLIFPWASPLQDRTPSIEGVGPWSGRPLKELRQIYSSSPNGLQGLPLAPLCSGESPGALRVAPRSGRAVVFFNHAPDLKGHGGEALHAGCPPLVEGEDKWIAQTWIRWHEVRSSTLQTSPDPSRPFNEFFNVVLNKEERAWRLPSTGTDPM